MADHTELVGEIPVVEKMSTQDRLKHAKKRRNQQLKRYLQYEKQLEKEQQKKSKKSAKKGVITMNAENKKRSKGKITFVNNIMLLEAAARNDIEEVRLLLMDGVSPDVTNEDGLTALHQCCIDDSEEMMKLLIEFGANVNARDSELWTPLHAAATCGHLHLCKYLIEKGADLLAVNADGNMPYDICEDEFTLDFIESEMSKTGVTQELIDDTRLSTERNMLADLRKIQEAGGDLEFRGRHGETPLHTAAANGYMSVAEFLLDHRVSTDVIDDDSWLPIHAAACWGHLPVLELLLQHGAELEATTKTGETALDICEDPELRQRLLELRDEIESNKATHSSDLSRKRSTNTRSSFTGSTNLFNSNASLAGHFSASVRRTSMREKSALSWKEAREEAMFRHPSGEDDEDDEEARAPIPPLLNGGREDINTREEVTLNNQVVEDKEVIPVTDIDQVTVVISAPAENEIIDDKIMPNNKSPANHKSTEHKENLSNESQNRATHRHPAPPPPPPAPPVSENHKISNGQSDLMSGRAPPPKPPTPPPRPGSPHNGSNIILPPNDKSITLPSGSLFHLKQQRALQLQNKMKSLQSSQTTLNGESGDSDSTPQTPTSTMLPTSETNGHSPSLTESRTTSPGSPFLPSESGDPPKHRFTANSPGEVIGGPDEKQNCCVIL